MPTSRSECDDSLQRLCLRTRPERIARFRFLLEGYDGLAILSTLDAATGLVRLLFPASRRTELLEFLAAMETELDLTPAPGNLDEVFDLSFRKNEIKKHV